MTARTNPALTGSVSNPKAKESARTRSCVASMVRKTKGRGGEMASPSLRPVAQYGASYSYVIPMPISVNAMYRNVPKVGRVKTTKYKNWCLEAEWELARQKPVRFDARVDISIYLRTPPRGTADCSNHAKAVEDLLVRCGVIKDDRHNYVRSTRTSWSDEETEARVILYHAPDHRVTI
jgi:Holliday junction resolvase RusA-like endonuclease